MVTQQHAARRFHPSTGADSISNANYDVIATDFEHFTSGVVPGPARHKRNSPVPVNFIVSDIFFENTKLVVGSPGI